MALVTHVIGDCLGCGGTSTFGDVEIFNTHRLGSYLYRGCKRCRYREQVSLPPLKKKVLYLDQFFFSHAFRGGERRFLEAAERIERLVSLQLLAAPFSSIHEDETHQWERRDELFRFVKATARGHEFRDAFDVERTQLVKMFLSWLRGEAPEYVLDPSDALKDELHAWDGYMRIEVGRYRGDIELIRDLKRQSVEGLVDLFPGWRELNSSFEEDLQAEYTVAGKAYVDVFIEFVSRLAGNDHGAMLDAPMASMVVQSLLNLVPEDVPEEDRLRTCTRFLFSEHFKQIPYQWLSAHMFASLKAMVKNGAYSNRERALQRLSGVFYDVKHIATYAPYVDVFVMDQPMAELASRATVRLEQRYGPKVFSRSNWDDFVKWLDDLEAEMTEEHRAAVATAYPRTYR